MEVYAPDNMPYPHEIWNFVESIAKTGFKNVLKAEVFAHIHENVNKQIVFIEADVLKDNKIFGEQKMIHGIRAVDFLDAIRDLFMIGIPTVTYLKVEIANGELPIVKVAFTPFSINHEKIPLRANQVFLD